MILYMKGIGKMIKKKEKEYIIIKMVKDKKDCKNGIKEWKGIYYYQDDEIYEKDCKNGIKKEKEYFIIIMILEK